MENSQFSPIGSARRVSVPNILIQLEILKKKLFLLFFPKELGVNKKTPKRAGLVHLKASL